MLSRRDHEPHSSLDSVTSPCTRRTEGGTDVATGNANFTTEIVGRYQLNQSDEPRDRAVGIDVREIGNNRSVADTR
jgi:hypothetical protein